MGTVVIRSWYLALFVRLFSFRLEGDDFHKLRISQAIINCFDCDNPDMAVVIHPQKCRVSFLLPERPILLN